MMIYRHEGHARTLTVTESAVHRSHIRIAVDSGPGACIPDDEIPALISGLQNYMSRKARELAKGDWREVADERRARGLRRYGMEAAE